MPKLVEASKGKKGHFYVVPSEVSPELSTFQRDGMEFRQVRVIFTVQGTKDTVNLGVDIADPAPRLGLFMDPTNAPANDADALKRFIKNNIGNDAYFVRVHNNFIQDHVAPEGKHIAKLAPYCSDEYLCGLRLFSNARGDLRVNFRLVTDRREAICWHRPFNDGIEFVDDDCHLNPNVLWLKEVCTLGLDYDRFKEELEEADYWFDSMTMNGIRKGFFENPLDPIPEINRMVDTHGAQPVQVTVVLDQQYGYGPPRGEYQKIELTPVIVAEGSRPHSQFEEVWKEFNGLWDSVVAMVMKTEDPLLRLGKLTKPYGLAIAKSVLVPIINAYPRIVKQEKPDGSPKIAFSTDLDHLTAHWSTDGVAALCFLAEELLKLDETELFTIANTTSADALLEWAAKTVPELSGDMEMEEVL